MGQLLIVIDTPPYGDWRGREALDMALSLAAFDRPVALLFRGPGVHWLRPGQEGEALGQKTVSRNLGAARMFGVTQVFADRAGLDRFNVQSPVPEVEPVQPDAPFYQGFTQVIQL
ncbi:MAG: DsrE family protein [Marinobacter sp.]